MVQKVKVLVIITAMITGCVSMQQAAMADCDAYGFQRGSRAWSECVMIREQQRGQAFERGMRGLYCSDPLNAC